MRTLEQNLAQAAAQRARYVAHADDQSDRLRRAADYLKNHE